MKAKATASDMAALRSLVNLYRVDEEKADAPPPSPPTGTGAVALSTPVTDMRPVALTPAPDAPLADSDFQGSVRMVEQAAAVIADYERRFHDIEVDARAFISRIDEEQQRLLTYVASLEMEVAAAQERGRRAEAALEDVRLQAWEERLMRRHAETRAADAEAEVERCETYLRRVYEVLDRLELTPAAGDKLSER